MSIANPAEVTNEIQFIRAHFDASIAAKKATAEKCGEHIAAAAKAIADAMRKGGKLMLCGNGGSAADCQHIAAEFVSVLNQSFLRPGLASVALTTDTSILTASANDFGFEGIFARQVQAIGNAGDILMGISTSGNSENVCRALEYAARAGLATISLTGESGGKMSRVSEICIRVPAAVTQYIQECHSAIGHILCALVEKHLFPKGSPPIN